MPKLFNTWVASWKEESRNILVNDRKRSDVTLYRCDVNDRFLELSVGMQTEGIEIQSVGNTITLQESTLVETFNLRAAIEFILKNCSSFSRLIEDWIYI